MKDFEFQIPTKIIFGRDTVSRIGVEARAYGKKVMFGIFSMAQLQ